MTKTRIILFLVAIVLVAVIYSLPRVVVDNESNSLAISERLSSEEEPHVASPGEVSDSLRRQINSLKDSFANSGNKEKRVIFADSLAKAFKTAFLFDSAAIYLGEVADEVQKEMSFQKAGDAYFDAFNFAVSKEKQASLGEKARAYYDKALELDPDNLNAKANQALTYVTSDSPMKGIGMLREILEKDPEHEQALFNMGLLSITSGQMDRAVERFTALLESHPDNYEARLYLGYSYMEIDQVEQARSEFEKVIASEADESLKSAAKQYIESINKF